MTLQATTASAGSAPDGARAPGAGSSGAGAAPPAARDGDGPVDLDGRRFYRIGAYDELPPFFMTLVSASDLWVFVSSTGGLTAGRGDADHALFPYATEDKVSDGAGRTGGLTLLRVTTPDGALHHWQPFAVRRPGDPAADRALYKDFLGTTLVLEETRADLGLRVRVSWRTSARYGLVRGVELASTGPAARVEVLDGFVDLLPAGVTVQTQRELSSLLDAYKRAEVDPATGLAVLYLNSTLTDRADPSESLAATVAWQSGLPADEVLGHALTCTAATDFAAGRPVADEPAMRGRRAAYLVHAALTVPAGGRRAWDVVADVEQDAAEVVRLGAELASPTDCARALHEDVVRTRAELERLVAGADGVQLTGDEIACAHHGANVLFNIMRGGVPVDGYDVRGDDVRAFVEQRSPRTAHRCAGWLAALPASGRVDALVAGARATGDLDLERLVREYLPLVFSRRHGDPSRPWNRFRIALQDEDGTPRVEFEGNWRDIFQNWEALATSFPEYVESMVAVFLDATTVDGYNPYRISRAGVDWEVPEPENPWANIGYWSDHQIVYLVKLLEASERYHPGRLAAAADRAVYTYADVPYRIAPYDAMVDDPIATITFDDDAERRVLARVADEGADGRLVHDAGGGLVRATLGEKLLSLVLAKLVNLVPDAGIWMNTQRPEWNDANNALVGKGVSVVTLAYLRRCLTLARDLLGHDVTLTAELADLLADVRGTLDTHAARADGGFDDAGRRAVMDALGAAGTRFRARAYAGLGAGRVTVAAPDVRALLDVAQRYVDAALRANRRPDGLFHSYDLLDLRDGRAAVGHLQEMLEGQVAVLSSGLLTPAEALDLVGALRRSRLYRADQHSYLLYPDRELPSFLERNAVPADLAAATPLLERLDGVGDRSVARRDVHGVFRFAPGIHNVRDVEAALAALPSRAGLDPDEVQRGRPALLETFERVFRHSQFTGRSGSFFAYEGLGSIYWHMVSKLLLAVQENAQAAGEAGDAASARGLRAAYDDVRDGLGYRKSAAVYGAFPVDPYSHTPAGAGARQPGMTGQVKEELLTRPAELGLGVRGGRIVVRPLLLRDDEWVPRATTLRCTDPSGVEREVDVPAGSLALTVCQVPVVVRRGAASSVTAVLADGRRVERAGDELDADLSAAVFRRTGEVVRLDVVVGAA
ncbi:hypothetical protein [Cellulomonas massiliensis]|uniref:hypothetical protein n=1 Tax=Cellulomonas massiliensis TaxID=1465811 RepID=UPI00030F5AD6|nr:hypothetical protein [Cellulomonas massiliensis]